MSDDLAARQARHQRYLDPATGRYMDHCEWCLQPWGEHGCDAAVLGAALEEAESWRDAWGATALRAQELLEHERQARQAAEQRAAQAEAERDKYLALWAEQGLVSRRYHEQAMDAATENSRLRTLLEYPIRKIEHSIASFGCMDDEASAWAQEARQALAEGEHETR